MKCVYRELKESITDATFPVLPVVLERSYFYQTVSGQEIDISSIVGTLKFNTIKVEAVLKFDTLDNDVNNFAMYLRGGGGRIGAHGTRAESSVWDTYTRVAATTGQDISFMFDGYNNVVAIDNTALSGTSPVTTSSINTGRLLGNSSLATDIKVKYIKVYDKTTDTLVAHLVPATLNGVGIVYDKVSGATLQPSTGSLGIV